MNANMPTAEQEAAAVEHSCRVATIGCLIVWPIVLIGFIVLAATGRM